MVIVVRNNSSNWLGVEEGFWFGLEAMTMKISTLESFHGKDEASGAAMHTMPRMC